MNGNFHFTFESDWRCVPGAFWVHLPVEANPGTFEPAAPQPVPYRGFAVLHVEFGKHELLFVSKAHLDHYIEILSRRALPTSRQLSEASGINTGPNQHWLSRLPGELKSPKRRQELVKVLSAAKEFAAGNAPTTAFNPDAPK